MSNPNGSYMELSALDAAKLAYENLREQQYGDSKCNDCPLKDRCDNMYMSLRVGGIDGTDAVVYHTNMQDALKYAMDHGKDLPAVH